MVIRFQTFEMIHGKKNVGSTRIRVHNLIKHWPEAGLYKYGEKPDVLIFQKVYVTQDYKFPREFPGIKILDITDPDWLEGAFIRQTVDAVDAVTCPTEPLAEFIRQMTDKPVKVIKDRFDLNDFPKPKIHEGKLKKVCWFGYSHNADTLKFVVPSLEKRKLFLSVISDRDPQVWRWGEDYQKMHEYKGYKPNTAYKLIQEADVVVLPKGYRPVDRFKSDNKTTISRLLGVPVVQTAEELDTLMEAEARNTYVKRWYERTRNVYNVASSIIEYKELIKELNHGRG